MTFTFADVAPAHMRLLVLDDLSKSDAKDYFLKQIPDDKRSLFKSDFDCFDSVFNMTGGRMIFIDQYVHDTIVNNAPPAGYSLPFLLPYHFKWFSTLIRV